MRRALNLAGLLLVVLLLQMSVGAPARAGMAPMIPLGELLQVDGTLTVPPGRYGALDLTGYQMVSGPGEAPRFEALAPVPAPTQPGNENWAGGFQVGG